MHTHPAAGERRRLSLVIMVAGYAAAWMVVAPVLAQLAQAGLIARHHLEAYPNYQLRYPPYTRDPKTAVDAALLRACAAPPCLPHAARPVTGAPAGNSWNRTQARGGGCPSLPRQLFNAQQASAQGADGRIVTMTRP